MCYGGNECTGTRKTQVKKPKKEKKPEPKKVEETDAEKTKKAEEAKASKTDKKDEDAKAVVTPETEAPEDSSRRLQAAD